MTDMITTIEDAGPPECEHEVVCDDCGMCLDCSADDAGAGSTTANEYQELASRTLLDEMPDKYSNEEKRALWGAMIICAAAGRVAEYVKKGVLHEHGFDREEYLAEVGWLITVTGGLLHNVPALQQDLEKPLSSQEIGLLWNGLGLVGEAGEIAETIINSVMGDDKNLLDQLPEELGDCNWYISALATTRGLSLGDIFDANIEKLKKRYPEGYSAESSRNRLEYRGDDR